MKSILIISVLLLWSFQSAYSQVQFMPHTLAGTTDSTDVGLNSSFAVDLDKDGDMDVIAGYSNTTRGGSLIWYENIGDAYFINHIIARNDAVSTLHAVDLDGDGDVDIISAEFTFGTGSIVWFENDGQQMFTAQTVREGLTYVNSVYGADMDNDGDMDICATSSGDGFSGLWIYENNGNQVFTRIRLSNSLFTHNPIVQDFDGNSLKDIFIISNDQTNTDLSVYSQETLGNFNSKTIRSFYGPAFSARIADIDNDDDFDVVLGSATGLFWYENDGSYNFTYHAIETGSITHRMTSVEVADLDNDGDTDILAVFDEGNKRFVWHENDGNGLFSSHLIGKRANTPTIEQAVDMNNDGKMDFLLSSFDRPVWYENDGNRNFFAHAVHPKAVKANTVLATDLDDDGDTDVIWSESQDSPYILHCLENNGDQVFRDHSLLSRDRHFVLDITVATINNDDKKDIIIASAGDPPLGTTSWFAYEDNFQYSQQELGLDNKSIYPADLDHNNLVDLVLCSSSGRYAFWYKNEGNGNFVYTELHSSAFRLSGANFAKGADIDGDGNTDVVCAERGRNQITWFENLLNDQFSPPQAIVENLSGIAALEVLDADGDGDMDLTSALDNSGEIFWHENNGNGQFITHFIADGKDGLTSLHGADLDCDGDTDLISSSENDNTIAWYENDGVGNFSQALISTDAIGAKEVYAADVDGDGDMDVLSASNGDGKVVWYENLYNNCLVILDPPEPTPPVNSYLYHNYPNPFNPTTTIAFYIAEKQLVTLKIYDLQGKLVVTLLDKELDSSEYAIPFDAQGLSSGVYIYQLRAGNRLFSRKMLYLR